MSVHVRKSTQTDYKITWLGDVIVGIAVQGFTLPAEPKEVATHNLFFRILRHRPRGVRHFFAQQDVPGVPYDALTSAQHSHVLDSKESRRNSSAIIWEAEVTVK